MERLKDDENSGWRHWAEVMTCRKTKRLAKNKVQLQTSPSPSVFLSWMPPSVYPMSAYVCSLSKEMSGIFRVWTITHEGLVPISSFGVKSYFDPTMGSEIFFLKPDKPLYQCRRWDIAWRITPHRLHITLSSYLTHLLLAPKFSSL